MQTNKKTKQIKNKEDVLYKRLQASLYFHHEMFLMHWKLNNKHDCVHCLVGWFRRCSMFNKSQNKLHLNFTVKLMIRFDFLQFADTLAALWYIFPSTGWSQFMRNGMFNCHFIHDAVICHCINSMFPMAYEQRSWCDNVFALFCIRCHFVNVRIQTLDVSILKRRSQPVKSK